MPELQEYREQLLTVLADFKEKAPIQKGQLIVIGCSTSEVIGEKSALPEIRMLPK